MIIVTGGPFRRLTKLSAPQMYPYDWQRVSLIPRSVLTHSISVTPQPLEAVPLFYNWNPRYCKPDSGQRVYRRSHSPKAHTSLIHSVSFRPYFSFSAVS
jgi:hypothetical protein